MRRVFGARRPTPSSPVFVGSVGTGASADDGRLGPGSRMGVSADWERAGGPVCGLEGERVVSVSDVASSGCLQGPGDDDSELLE